MINNANPIVKSVSLTEKVIAYFQLLKFRLSALVVFSAGMTYMLGYKAPIDWAQFTIFIIGGFLATSSANVINQIWEVDLDKLMKRTMHRPLPTGVLSLYEAAFFCVVTGVVGLSLLYFYINPLTALITLVSMIMYGFIYTPMKQISPIAVLIGAFPGAFPPLIGWVAATGNIGTEALVLFGIQFIWQFPHFWAIAWVLDDDYQKAGFRLLPSDGGKNIKTAFQIMIYTLLLIPLGLLPAHLGITGLNSAIIATVCGTLFLMQTFYLMRDCSNKSALRIMFGSFLYLPIVQISFLLDKI
jgi:protoheme IX farnesyltransferase